MKILQENFITTPEVNFDITCCHHDQQVKVKDYGVKNIANSIYILKSMYP